MRRKHHLNPPHRRRVGRRPVSGLLLLLLACAWFVTVQSRGQEAPAAQEEAPAEPAEQPAGGIVVGKIDGEINLVESAYVQRLIRQADEQGAHTLLIELNTFGGRVDAAVTIRDALLDADLRTVVFINKRAISAGALISLACDKVAISPGGTIGAATPIQSTPGAEMAQPVEEKYLSYFREEMRVTAETKGRSGDVAEAMVDADKEIEGVSEAGKLLTLSTQRALDLGMADVEAESVEEALDKLGIAGEQTLVVRTWSEALVGFLTSPAIASLLFLMMMVLGYLEYQTPGFGVFGMGAITCFLILFFSHYLVNLAGWEDLLLFALGLVLLIVELFITPGFGVLGGLGILCILASAVLLFMAGDWGDFSFDNPITLDAVGRVLLSAVLGIVVLLLMIRFFPRTASGRVGRLVLATALGTSAGYTSHEEVGEESLLGQEGTAATPLRPAGRALIGGRRLEVETEGDFIEKGAPLKVVRRKAGRIIVRRA